MRLEKDGDTRRMIRFDVYGLKAMGSINSLPPTLASRCIRLGMLRAPGDCPQVRTRLDEDPGLWAGLRDDLHAFTLAHAGAILRRARGVSNATDGMPGRDAELWRPLLDLAGLCEEAGVADLVADVRQFADRVIAEGADDQAPEAAEVLVSALAAHSDGGNADITPGELLAEIRRSDPAVFSGWKPRQVSNTLGNCGIRIHKTRGGRRSYHRVTVDQIRRAVRAYGLGVPIPHGRTGGELRADRDDGADTPRPSNSRPPGRPVAEVAEVAIQPAALRFGVVASLRSRADRQVDARAIDPTDVAPMYTRSAPPPPMST